MQSTNTLASTLANSHLIEELQKKKNDPLQTLTLTEQTLLALVSGEHQEEAIGAVIRDNILNKKRNTPEEGLGFFKFPMPQEIIFYLFSFLNLNDLLKLKSTSSHFKLLMEDYFFKNDMLYYVTHFSSEELMKIILEFRNRSEFQTLKHKTLTKVKMTTKELVIYALTTKNVMTINFFELDEAINRLEHENENKLRTSITDNHLITEYNSTNNLIKSLKITSWAIKRTHLKQTMNMIDEKIKLVSDSSKRQTLGNGLLIEIQKDVVIATLIAWYRAKTQKTRYSLGDILTLIDEELVSAINDIKFSETKIFCNLAGVSLANFLNNGIIIDDLFGVNLEDVDLSENSYLLSKTNLLAAFLKNTNLANTLLSNTKFDTNILTAKIENSRFISISNNNLEALTRFQELAKIFRGKRTSFGIILAKTIITNFKYSSHKPSYESQIEFIKNIKTDEIFSKKSGTYKSGRDILTAYEDEIYNNGLLSKGLERKKYSQYNGFSGYD